MVWQKPWGVRLESLTYTMGESASLRARDYRTIIRMIGECRDLGADPIAWRLHLLKRLCALMGARVGAGGEATGMAKQRFIPLSTVDVGWENDDQRQGMLDWMELQARDKPPVGLLPLREPTTQYVILSRDEYYANQQQYKLSRLADHLRRSEVDDLISSMQRLSLGPDRFSGITIMRGLGEGKFRPRDKTFLRLLHEELAPMVGRQLAAADEPSATQLSPRLRQVLDCLLEGDSEKQVAARLGLTAQTVSQYVKAIYRHFRVNSRAELMARWIRFDRSCRLPEPAAQRLAGRS